MTGDLPLVKVMKMEICYLISAKRNGLFIANSALMQNHMERGVT
jgi:hypothetical protein